MTEDAFDSVLGDRLRAYAAGKHLPSDFGDRLVRSIRRTRARRRTRRIVAVCAVLAASALTLGLMRTAPRPSGDAEYLVAVSAAPHEDSRVSDWVVLGCFRECIRRLRGFRRKHDED